MNSRIRFPWKIKFYLYDISLKIKNTLFLEKLGTRFTFSEGAFAFIVLFFLTFTTYSVPFSTGLDPSWQYAINYAFEHGLIFGKNLVFTYGPIGFIISPGPMYKPLLWANLTVIITVSYLIISLIFLVKESSADRSIKRYINYFIAYLVLLIADNYTHVRTYDLILITISTTLSYLYFKTKKPVYLYMSVPVLIIGFLCKFGAFIMCFALNIYNLLATIRNKKIKEIFLYLFFLIALSILPFLYFFKNLENLLNFTKGYLELSLGYFSALSTSENNILLIILLPAMFLTFYRTKNPIAKKFFITGLLFFWLLIKYTVGVEGPWFISFLSSVYIIYALIFTIILETNEIFPFIKRFVLSWFVLLIFAMSVSVGVQSYETIISNSISQSLNFSGLSIYKMQSQMAALKNETVKNLKADFIPISFLGTIKKETVDVYPWEVSVIGANSLNWDPRPVFQSYTDYTPWLDRLNDKFLNSNRAPEYYIWFGNKGYSDVQSLRNAMLFNNDPLTVLDILKNYKMILRENRITLLKKAKTPQIGEKIFWGQQVMQWGKWTRIPADLNSHKYLLQAKITIKRNFLGTIKRLLYKEGPITIEYKDFNGTIYTYRLAPDNASEGVWISPLPVNLKDKEFFMSALPIKSFRLVTGDQWLYKKDIDITWEKIDVFDKNLINIAD